MAACPDSIKRLVERFTHQLDQVRSPDYNEATLRIDFVNPMFAELGWDIDNGQGFAEQYREVVHEDRVRIAGANKAPDYSFRVGGTRKFFLEAKKPSVNIKTDWEPAYQLRRYAWSAKLAASLLTDFEEFAVYDTRIKPKQLERASVARREYITYDQYEDRWDFISGTFSKQAVLRGDFDRYCGSTRGRGAQEFDDAFLEEIEEWRKALASNLALRNDGLDDRALNFAVQRIIDRIIFLRICEDRGIEHVGQLRALLGGDQAYLRLQKLFGDADDRYNSGLFYFKPEKGRDEQIDELTPGLDVDDATLKSIIRRLYYPESPYEFTVVSADILGSVYERFLGSVVTLTAGHRSRIEEKPEVRKAGGVYYTPTYIVDYIVQQTVGQLLEGKTPKDAAKLKILDPACGSGSFLIGAYQHLLDWHLNWYVADGPQNWSTGKNPRLRPGPAGDWRLTIKERKRILLDNIHGVDIDYQAVEVTKLSLLLKVLEGETAESLSGLWRLFHERALPDLGHNVQCGNSLIGTDIMMEDEWPRMPSDTQQRTNPLSFEEAFPTVLKHGGFDAVIGNPPYVLLQDDFRDDVQGAYFRRKYTAAAYKLDTYHLFLERGLILARVGGRCGFITPSNFLTNNHLAGLRRFLLTHAEVGQILVLDGRVFHAISVDTAITVLSKALRPHGNFKLVRCAADERGLRELSRTEIGVPEALATDHVLFTASTDVRETALWSKVTGGSTPLKSIAAVNFGKQLRDRREYTEDVIQLESNRPVPKGYRACYTGKDVNRYALRWGHLVCLASDAAQRGGCWDPARHTAKNKLLTRQIGRTPAFALDDKGFDCLNTIFMINLLDRNIDPYFVLGILNSRLLAAYWLARFYDRRTTFPKIKGTYLKELPIRFSPDADAQSGRSIGDLARSITTLREKQRESRLPQERERLGRQIIVLDRQIDGLVYKLYHLTDGEIRMVENATAPPQDASTPA